METKKNQTKLFTNTGGSLTQLYPYQEEGVSTIEKHNGRVLLADEMGLGKSIQALSYLHRHPSSLPAVVVCPATLKWVWEHEARHHLGMLSEVVEGQNPQKSNLLKKHGLIIINYEILDYWVDYLKSLKIQTVIIDECHFVKSRTAKRTKAVFRLSKSAKHIIAISGTPLTNRPAELFTTLKLLWPKDFPSFWSFAFEYCQPSRRPWGWDFRGAANLDQLHGQLKEKGMIRRLKADVLKDLPEKTREVIKVPIVKRSQYNKALTDFLAWLNSESPEKAARAARAEKLVKIGYLKRLAARYKMKAAIQWIDNFLESSDEKLVVYGIHKKIIQYLHNKYKDISVVVDGSVKGKDRKLAVMSFQQNPKVRLFIGNIKAAGTGLTLTASSSLAFVELSFVPAEMTQAEDRIHRIGQKAAANIYYLVARDTIEERLCSVIQEKQKVLSAILDGDETVNEIDVYDQLERELLRGSKK